MTLGELLVAAAISLSILGGVLSAVIPAYAAFAADQEGVDIHQRLRVAVETLSHDIRPAASVRPYRTGAINDDGRAGVFFRAGTLTTKFADPLPGETPDDPSRTYYLRTSAGTTQLMRYDGLSSTFPVLDDVVGLSFDFFGVREPPAIAGAGPLRATYGPAPPDVGVDVPSDTWGPGENCTFTVLSGAHQSRLTALADESVPLAASSLTDGPWCPDAAAADRFDADLWRVRRVRVRLRLQAPLPFRGPAGPFFLNPGTARTRLQVPDREVRFDVELRNWHAGS